MPAMPTTKPRVQVTLEPEVFETIQRYSDLLRSTKQPRWSMSAVIADLLQEVHEPLRRTVSLLEAARDAPVGVREDLAQRINASTSGLSDLAESTKDQLDFFLDAWEDDTPPAEPSDDDRDGMAWWNDQDERTRAYWLSVADSARPVDAWRAYKRVEL